MTWPAYNIQNVCSSKYFSIFDIQIQLMLQSKRIKAIRKYLNKDERLCEDLIKITKYYKQKPNHYALSTFLNNQLSPIVAFKYMILLQTLVFQDAINNQLCINLLTRMQWQKDKELDKIVAQKYLNTYKLFLQKLCHLSMKQLFDGQQKEIIVYQMINLILMVQPLSHIIYTFGRYFSEHYKFIIDFNIIMAKDLCSLYNVISNNTSNKSNKFLKEIQVVNQSLYPIYFNNYFYRIVSKYQPKFISTDIPQTPKKKHSKNNRLAIESTLCSTLEINSNLLTYMQKRFDQNEYIVQQFNDGEKKPINILAQQSIQLSVQLNQK